jgi:outer membrane biosynthesis protein TonB
MMRQYTARFTSVVALAAVLSLAACGGEKAPEERDVNLATPTTAEPQLQDVPVAAEPAPPPAPAPKPVVTPPKPAPKPAPVAPKPAPAPARAEYGEIAAGSNLSVRTSAQLCTNTHKVGDRFTATVSETVMGTEGVSIPAGATATLQVTESVRGENDPSKIKFAFKVVSLSFGGNTYDVVGADIASAPVERVRRQTTGDQAKKIGAGAAIGAIAGQIIGKNTRSTVIGGAVGAAGGAIAANATADYDGCVATDSRLTARLASGLRIKVAAE